MVVRPDDSRLARGLHGLTRTLVTNAVEGVTRATSAAWRSSASASRPSPRARRSSSPSAISHPVDVPAARRHHRRGRRQGRPSVTVTGADKHLVGMTAAKIRTLRRPSRTRARASSTRTRHIRRKEGKTGAPSGRRARLTPVAGTLDERKKGNHVRLNRRTQEEGRMARKVTARRSARPHPPEARPAPPQRPRLTVYRSLKHIYAQVVDDSSRQDAGRGHDRAPRRSRARSRTTTRRPPPRRSATAIAKACQGEGRSTQVVFDRNGFAYHGRVAAVADAAREAGLKF